jgi:recombination protein RecR
MSVLPRVVVKVIEEFERLPGVGPKSAARMAYHFLRSPNGDASKLGKNLLDMDENVVFCSKCFNVSEKEICDLCSSPLREKSKLCVVEESLDIVAFEGSGIYNGMYFVLGGVISPADGIGAEELRFPDLKKRVQELTSEGDLEIIVATNPSLEGEATMAYIQDLLKGEKKVSITRLAMGLPTGADLEYADSLTLRRALEGRKKV